MIPSLGSLNRDKSLPIQDRLSTEYENKLFPDFREEKFFHKGVIFKKKNKKQAYIPEHLASR